ncbi:hypothetical protein CFC21_068728 [Triticum aestivum]|uniref:Uncharacterized protein n=2 Tax=Triticum aestivum TaxID=4565 RepID=A0A9R1KPZ9_WHEAT|nr:uncharacterized protein LOC119303935 [Triticum dicoccoides]XP_044386029.1 uncharacterized protein LOC123108274 [Triticum aestivum]XP_048532573.1 uncharacterized protein LOC125511287 [Triticum urartu]KAF7062090.1 hypothetical protein CFC21_068728 [Triticum aestivum]
MAPEQGSRGAKADAAAMETAGRGGGGRPSSGAEAGWAWSWACCAVAAGVAAVGLAGAGVLVWWAVAFHPAREQLWMVPVGLVLLGTPLVAWLSLFASGACRRLGTSHHHPPPAER